MRANQIEQECIMGLFLADHKQDADGLGLDLDDTQQIHDGAAALALRKERSRGARRDTLERRRGLGTFLKDLFDLRHPFAELPERGMDHCKDGGHMLYPKPP